MEGAITQKLFIKSIVLQQKFLSFLCFYSIHSKVRCIDPTWSVTLTTRRRRRV